MIYIYIFEIDVDMDIEKFSSHINRLNYCLLDVLDGLFGYIKLTSLSLSEINAGFFYFSAEQRETMVAAERRSVYERVRKIIKLKKKVLNSKCNIILYGFLRFSSVH